MTPSFDPASRTGARAAAVVTVAATMALAWQAARLSWLLWPDADTEPPPPPALSLDDAGGSGDTGPDYQRIASAHLFGEATAEKEETETPREAPETQLDLTLRGVLAGDDGTSGLAIIAAGGDPDALFRHGDELPGGAVIDAIYGDRVILMRNGRHEALNLPEDSLGAGTETATQSPSGNTQTAGDGSLQRYRDRLRRDPGALQRMLQPVPVRDANGNLTGFRIEGGNRELLSAAGLESGDVVTSIDGIALENQQAAMRALQRLGNASRVTLTVTRNGNRRQVVLDFGNQG